MKRARECLGSNSLPLPAYALLERLFERALARASACASLHIEGLPAAGAA